MCHWNAPCMFKMFYLLLYKAREKTHEKMGQGFRVWELVLYFVSTLSEQLDCASFFPVQPLTFHVQFAYKM